MFLEFKADSYFTADAGTLWQTFESLFYVICIYACCYAIYMFFVSIDSYEKRKTVLIIITLFCNKSYIFNRVLAEVFSL